MNDELERRLRNLRPAELPRDLLRSLRSAEPAPRAKRRWPREGTLPDRPPWSWRLAGVGLLVASVWMLAVWFLPRPGLPDSSRRVSATPADAGSNPGFRAAAPAISKALPRENTVAGSDRARNAPPAFDGFRNDSFPADAALGGGLNTRAGSGFHLEMPTGPIRLDRGYTLVGNDFNNYPFGKFNLNVSDSF